MGGGKSKLERKLGPKVTRSEIGPASPKQSPLDIALWHFGDYFDQEMCSQSVLKTKCQYHWPSFSNWPRDGTLHSQTILELQRFLKNSQDSCCLPDDLLYAEAWLELSKNVPQAPCEQSPPFASRAAKSSKESPLEQPSSSGQAPSGLPPPPSSGGKAEKVLKGIEQPPQLSSSRMASSPPPMRDKEEQNGAATGLQLGWHSNKDVVRRKKEGGGMGNDSPGSNIQLSSAEAFPIGITAGISPGSPRREERIVDVRSYVPFSTSDLLNWRNHGVRYEEDPVGFIDIVEGIIHSQNPTWADIQQLQAYLLTGEQRRTVQENLEEAARTAATRDGAQNPAEHLAQLAPTTNPKWGLNSEEGIAALTAYQTAFLAALRKGKKKLMNMQKVYEVTQGPDECPGDFLERLRRAFRMHSPLDPDEDNNRATIVLSFVGQSAPDIRRKLQKTEGFVGMSLSQLKAIADKVYYNRSEEAEKERTKRQKEKACLLAAALQKMQLPGKSELGRGGYFSNQRGQEQGQGRGVPASHNRPYQLGQDQCAYCKEVGHWRATCSKRIQSMSRGQSRERGQMVQYRCLPRPRGSPTAPGALTAPGAQDRYLPGSGEAPYVPASQNHHDQ